MNTGPINASGPITAPNFIGDGSKLINTPILPVPVGSQCNKSNSIQAGWVCMTSTPDGTNLFACVGYGSYQYVYASTDGGKTWNQRSTLSVRWQGIVTDPTGTNLVACVSGSGYIYTSSNGGTNWSSHAALNNWMSIAASSNLQYILCPPFTGKLQVSSDYGVTWTQVGTVVGTGNSYSWFSSAVSANGQYMYAPLYGGLIYVSSNYGITWTGYGPSTGKFYAWTACCCDPTGQYVYAADFFGAIWYSTNYGVTWTQSNSTIASWLSLNCDPTGQYLVATQYPGHVYYSNDYGVNWFCSNSPVKFWVGACINPDGESLVACAYNPASTPNWSIAVGDYIYTLPAPIGTQTTDIGLSANSNLLLPTEQAIKTYADRKQMALAPAGLTWSQQGTSEQYSDIACNIDGSCIFAADLQGNIYVSLDYGVTWTSLYSTGTTNKSITIACSAGSLIIMAAVYGDNIYLRNPMENINFDTFVATPAGVKQWFCCCMSDTGGVLVAGVGGSGGGVWVSKDLGYTWTTNSPTQQWSGVACSHDGTFIVAIAAGTGVYVSRDYGVTWTEVLSGVGSCSVTCSWDGSKIAVIPYGASSGNPGTIYISNNYGASWASQTTTISFGKATSDGTGQFLAVGQTGSNGAVYTSNDYGATWRLQNSPSKQWSALCMCYDASLLMGCAYSDYLYKSTLSQMYATIDGTLSENSNSRIPTEEAVKTYVDTNAPHISTGTSSPATTPAKVGDVYVDTTNKKIYFATGTSSSSDWTIVN